LQEGVEGGAEFRQYRVGAPDFDPECKIRCRISFLCDFAIKRGLFEQPL
jgi:hypothetical protein